MKHTYIKHHLLDANSLWRQYRRDHNIRGAGRIHHPLLRLHWLFVWSMHSGKSTVFFLLWRALARRLRSGFVSSLFDTRWHTHSLSLLFGRGARTRCPWGENLHALWAFSMKKFRSRLSLFRERRGSRLLPVIRDPPLPRHGGKWNRGVCSWIWPMS